MGAGGAVVVVAGVVVVVGGVVVVVAGAVVVVGGAVVVVVRGFVVVGGAVVVVGGAIAIVVVVGGVVVVVVVVGGGAATLTVKVSVVLNEPSETVTVMVVTPASSGAMFSRRRESAPLIAMAPSATTAWFDEVAVTLSADVGCSLSPTSTPIAGTAVPRRVVRSVISAIVGAVFES